MSVEIEAKSLRKTYGSVTAVHDFTHSFTPGKITAILGPSGSGKSTTLSMIAGLIAPDGGHISLGGADITRLPAERRDFAMVFQDYSLFPHLDVAQNVEFGLRVRGIGKKERHGRAMEALERVHIRHLAKRRINQISGGERQRVALARALVYNPGVLLLDEPLSALDAKLRESLRHELARILGELSITTIYVTHDQVEAMSLGHEMIIMQDGRIEQAGTAHEIYTRPVNAFVANFLGSANILEGECRNVGGRSILRLPFGELPLPEERVTGACRVMVRPEDIAIVSDAEGQWCGEVISSVFLGSQARLTVSAGGRALAVDTANDLIPSPGSTVALRIDGGKLWLMPEGV